MLWRFLGEATKNGSRAANNDAREGAGRRRAARERRAVWQPTEPGKKTYGAKGQTTSEPELSSRKKGGGEVKAKLTCISGNLERGVGKGDLLLLGDFCFAAARRDSEKMRGVRSGNRHGAQFDVDRETCSCGKMATGTEGTAMRAKVVREEMPARKRFAEGGRTRETWGPGKETQANRVFFLAKAKRKNVKKATMHRVDGSSGESGGEANHYTARKCHRERNGRGEEMKAGNAKEKRMTRQQGRAEPGDVKGPWVYGVFFCILFFVGRERKSEGYFLEGRPRRMASKASRQTCPLKHGVGKARKT
ncbi:hypothetical protein, conserved in T. vivax [Trypanosoma vivax Y486]|uniref:Uncharacterized protein n=1 Tax=Trypanosoma vivax (strain Y486) TaxID=1055687 RepID=F9WN39_TRYVY|nr:hypothetical protein, conserved in T. vivax [Trypanosoma vivax Y486]|eukprot:CCD18953.1 hypothetical protein, conserved in T. vivax [Trypanosoma vivax Y486]